MAISNALFFPCGKKRAFFVWRRQESRGNLIGSFEEES
ncbi:hypothetical protein RU99_GL000836 [Enterococcus casseliflavus]|nr:hypothetical protein RU99_GL000836 [Enterococcus casseliflavus]